MRVLRKIIAFFCTFSIVLSLLVVPAFAGSFDGGIGGTRSDFWEWLTSVSGGGSFSGSVGGSRDGYAEWVTTLPGSTYNSVTGSWIYYPTWTYSVDDSSVLRASGSANTFSFGADFISSGNSTVRAVGSTVPVAGEGTYRLRVPAYSVSGYGANRPDAFAQSYWLYADGTQKTSSLTTLSTSSVKSQSFNYSLSDPPSIGFQPRLGVSLYNSSTHVSFSVASPPYVEFEPTYPAAFAQPAETRPSTIIGNYGIIGDDGTISKSENQYIVNETNSTIYNPVTNTTVDMSGWSYDYSTRTYTITTDNSQTITVTYGDEYVTINEGDTIYNVYYIVDGSGGGGTTDPDTPSGGDDSTIGGMIESLISGLGSVVGGIIKGLLSLLTKALEALSGIGDLFVALAEQVTGIFGGFTAFLAAVFPFLPEEFFTVLTLGFVLLIAAAVIRKLLGK